MARMGLECGRVRGAAFSEDMDVLWLGSRICTANVRTKLLLWLEKERNWVCTYDVWTELAGACMGEGSCLGRWLFCFESGIKLSCSIF